MTTPPELDDITAERDALRQQLCEVIRHRDEILAALRELQAEVRMLRTQAEERTAVLHRLRELERGRAAERDPNRPLN